MKIGSRKIGCSNQNLALLKGFIEKGKRENLKQASLSTRRLEKKENTKQKVRRWMLIP
jgi:hypothetical protein